MSIEAPVYKARRIRGEVDVEVKIATSLDELAALGREGWANTEDDARAALIAEEAAPRVVDAAAPDGEAPTDVEEPVEESPRRTSRKKK